MAGIFERLDAVDHKLKEISKNPLTRVYPLVGDMLAVVKEMSSIARESITNVDAALESKDNKNED